MNFDGTGGRLEVEVGENSYVNSGGGLGAEGSVREKDGFVKTIP